MKTLAILVGILCLVSVHAGAEDPLGLEGEEFAERDPLPGETTDDSSDSGRSGAEPTEAEPNPPTEDDLAKVGSQQLSISGDSFKGCVNPYWNFVAPAFTVLGCCPRKWNYRCYSRAYRLPCFYDYQYRQYCCPLTPTIYARACQCRSCAVQTDSCSLQGVCTRRYTKRWFLGICYNRGWTTFRTFVRSVPSSCYCNTRRRYPVTWNLETALQTKS